MEIYRVKLPGDPVIGEGKPENQNHAIIFTRGEAIQAIDMNQDGYLEEAFKMRNLLEEFKYSSIALDLPLAGIDRVSSMLPQRLRKDVPIVDLNYRPQIVGFREHVFTGSVSILANYMALQVFFSFIFSFIFPFIFPCNFFLLSSSFFFF